ncbi:MAG TPA: hypothetical protein PKD63_00595 [Solirubrobacteraceae bacterium]|nr:hypothetical protein [Solirubrobacteraceae bacterium]
MSGTVSAGDADVPKGLIDSVVHLVSTGPVPLGAYTLAEIDAVNGVIDFIEREPAPELVAEAVRSLAARNLITTAPGADEVQVRGDLGIAIAFQERARIVLDARVTGSEPDQPWRFLLLPQPEGVTLEILIDALGIHFYELRTTEDALERLWERLPHGDRGPADASADAVLAASPRTALVSVSHWEADGTRDTHDLVLARDDDVCHTFVRDPASPRSLVAQGMDEDEWRALVRGLAVPRPVAGFGG